MATATKSKYEEILSEMADSIAEHLESFPEQKRKRIVKAIAAYSFDAPKRPAKTVLPKNGTNRSQERSRPK
jgi:hypothetical protein